MASSSLNCFADFYLVTARRYASAVYAVVVCRSVCLFVTTPYEDLGEIYNGHSRRGCQIEVHAWVSVVNW